VLERLLAARISARRGIMATHHEAAHDDLRRPSLPVTDMLARRSIILPLHHELTDADLRWIVEALAVAVGRSADTYRTMTSSAES
jgi:perosamine synthetase